VIWFANEKRSLAVVALADKIKTTSKDAVAQLKALESMCICSPEIVHQLRKLLLNRQELNTTKQTCHLLQKQICKDLQQQGKIVRWWAME